MTGWQVLTTACTAQGAEGVEAPAERRCLLKRSASRRSCPRFRHCAQLSC